MSTHLTIPEIETRLIDSAKEFSNYCMQLSDEDFFHQPEGKWSAAQQVKHLIISANMSRLAFILPRFIVRLIGGKPNRTSRTYEDLVAKYKLKLEQGGRASGRFVPKPISAAYSRDKMMNKFNMAMQKFTKSVIKHKDTAFFENYLAPHPLLGKITLRELCYFTVYHTYHHLNNIKLATTQ
jgi:DinB superfamily